MLEIQKIIVALEDTGEVLTDRVGRVGTPVVEEAYLDLSRAEAVYSECFAYPHYTDTGVSTLYYKCSVVQIFGQVFHLDEPVEEVVQRARALV